MEIAFGIVMLVVIVFPFIVSGILFTPTAQIYFRMRSHI